MREGNLLALAPRDAVLAARVQAAVPDPRISFAISRTGQAVPCVRIGGRPLPLHSLVDPVREGERIAASVRGAGFVVSLGLGAGFHLRHLLSHGDISTLVVVEKDPAVLSALLSGTDMRDVLSDPRLIVLAGEGIADLTSAILGAYHPILSGALRTVSVRPWCETEKAWSTMAADGVRRAADAARADFATQARFGRRWFSNILANLPLAEKTEPAAATMKPRLALVTGAGPSLDDQIPEIARRSRDAFLVATDTSLPALEANGIHPDFVVSIDCQVHSVNHFLGGSARQQRLVMDLASPPLLGRLVSRSSFAASSHPLCALLARRWRPFMPIDTAGGNVTHAAVSFAGSLGAQQIIVYGADFSYPDGAPYARGTYLFDYFGCRSGRLLPIETSFFSFLFRAGDPLRERLVDHVRYTTPLLMAYKENLEKLAAGMTAELIAAPGRGLALKLRRQGPGPSAEAPAGSGLPLPRASALCGWREFLREYRASLQAAPIPVPPLAAWFARLDPEAREMWQTMLPIAAVELRERAGAAATPDGHSPARSDSAGPGAIEAEALTRARAWALGRISRALSEDDPRIAHE